MATIEYLPKESDEHGNKTVPRLDQLLKKPGTYVMDNGSGVTVYTAEEDERKQK